MSKVWVEPDRRDEIIDYLGYWSKRAEFPVVKMLQIIDLRERKFYEWKERYGLAREHNGKQPKEFWLTETEKEAIIKYAQARQTSGYRMK